MSIVLKCLEPRPMAQIRLICVPHAGAGASMYRPWLALLPSSIEPYALQLPTREERYQEPALQDWETLQEELRNLATNLSPMPTVIFGHSLGALIALLLAREIETYSKAHLSKLFVSAFPWPGSFKGASSDVFKSDDAFIDYMEKRFGSLGDAMENAEIREIMLPILKADIKLLATYQHSSSTQLATPLHAFYGENDPSTDLENIMNWEKETTADFSVSSIKGGHLYHIEMPDLLVPEILKNL